MSFRPIDQLGLDLAADDVMSAFAPFVSRTVSADDPEWRRHLALRKRRILKKGMRRLLTGWLPRGQRREGTVVREYSEVWGGTDWDQYGLETPPRKFSPWQWRDRLMLASAIGATRFRQLMLVRLLERHRPHKVLEVGCGNGINLLLLAGRFPGVELTGVELTPAGHDAALAFQRRDELPPSMAGFAPLPLEDPTAFKRVRFVQGSAESLPFDTASFDLVYTILALEQMERIRDRALSEIARVTAGHTFMIEPFRDVNARGWRRMNVLRRDYFRAAIADLPRHGLDPVASTDDFPQETFLGACAVLCVRRPR